jgi:beta-glucuronidase
MLAAALNPADAATPLINNVSGRVEISLNGTWRAMIDPYGIGRNASFFKNAKPAPSELLEYNFDTSGTLNVPGDWNSQRPELFFYEGSVWYEKSFSYHQHNHARVFIYFGAANYAASAYLNGKQIGEHEGGFTPFNFEVTNEIVDGENLIVVEVNRFAIKCPVPSHPMSLNRLKVLQWGSPPDFEALLKGMRRVLEEMGVGPATA